MNAFRNFEGKGFFFVLTVIHYKFVTAEVTYAVIGI